MTERDLFGLRVEIDEEATRAWYAQADEWDCDCGDCRKLFEAGPGQDAAHPSAGDIGRAGHPTGKVHRCVRIRSGGGRTALWALLPHCGKNPQQR